jgi:hypothetical protein
MSTPTLKPEELTAIAQAIEDVMRQLQIIEQGKEMRPMQYTARLSWELLYEYREILRAKQSAS